ncbi:hypothetical protein N0V83_005867 [Neocucurbitaria cava]|uniref:Cytochrome P450 n=1 Tax=Neocucurbitaria cava TaxID=798079 RepID=A0A9W8Y8W1_9PLEO|nr:hypothetical protein N0V83_005867 [Neocucurbitaria cava]
MAIFSFTNIAVSLLSLYFARRIYWESTTGTRRRALAKQHGCLPAKQRLNRVLPNFLPDMLGIDMIISQYRAYKAHRMLEQEANDLRSAGAHTIQTSALGLNVFITDDPENVKALLATNFEVWSLGQSRIKRMSSYLGHGIFTNEGKAWKCSREMLRPCFERSAVADVSIFKKHTERLIGLLPLDGSEVDLQPLFHELTLDVATEFLFGRSTNSLGEGGGEDEGVKAENIKKWGFLGALLPDKKKKRSIKIIQDFIDKVIDEELCLHEEEKKNKKDTQRYIFLHELVTATQDRTVIRNELLNILLAGRDTTASLLSNLVWELSRQPTVLARLREEVDSVVGTSTTNENNNSNSDEDAGIHDIKNDHEHEHEHESDMDPPTPTYAQLKELKYLRAIINESQRLYPVVPANGREALHDTILPHGGGGGGGSGGDGGGNTPLFIPKASYVQYNTYSMHRRASLFGPDPETFRPERWLNNDSNDHQPLRPGWAYIPFSGGPRSCLGQNFALTEAMFVVVRLVQKCEIERRDEGVWREKVGLTCMGLGVVGLG